jgi:membrane-bound lytic murein transglycosylase D
LRAAWLAPAAAVLALPLAAGAADPFPTPPALAPAVRFWIEVFTRYSVEEAVVHDRFDPALVHRVVRTRDPERLAAELRVAEDRLVLRHLTAEVAGEGLLLRAPAEPVLAVTPRLRAQRGMRETFAQGLAGQRLYGAIVEAALAREGLPTALAALPLIESAYHPGAVSRAGAVGLWQLIPDTARLYVTVEGMIDERRDPVRASEAAARHLRALHAALGTWPLALTAYNRGLAGVQRAMAAVRSDDLAELVARPTESGLGFASRNFYVAFLAARHVSQHARRYFPEARSTRLVEYRVKRGDTLAGVARRHGVSLAALRVTNGLRSAALQPGQRILVDAMSARPESAVAPAPPRPATAQAAPPG